MKARQSFPASHRAAYAAFTLACLGAVPASAATVTYTMQTGNFNSLQTQNNNNPPYAGSYNNGATEMAQYANGGSGGTMPGAAAFQTFNTTGNGNSGSARALQVGDTFSLTAYVGQNPSSAGSYGVSFRDSTTYSGFSSSTDAATEARFQLDNTGGWRVYHSGGSTDSGLGSGADRTFTIKITSATTFDATIGANTYRNLTMAASGGTIDSFAIYNSSNVSGAGTDAYWKNGSLTDTGTVELGYAAANGSTFTPGVVSDGLAADSTSTARSNAVFVGGDAGSQVNLAQNNTYTGATTINANATGEAQHANALGSTAAGTTVSNNGTLKLYSASGISYASESLTLNGLGVSGANGALRNVGGSNTWNGAITLGSSSRINADTSGGAGALTLAGGITGGSNVLFLGANGANISISGALSGAGASQDGTTTSLYKDGAGTLTLSGNNSYTGDTRVVSGTLTVASGGNLGSGSDVFISSGAAVNINTNTTIASVQETGNSNGGTVAIGSGATLTVNGASKGVLFQNSISGAGGVTVNGSGNTSLNLYGTQSYTGATTVSGGQLSTGVALATSGVTINGGRFETTAANILGNSVTVSLSSGTYSIGGNDTIGTLSMSGGSLGGSGTLTASSYEISGGSVAAALGAGSLVSSGNSTINASTAVTSVAVNSGVLTVGASGGLTSATTITIASGAELDVSANTFTVGSTQTLAGAGRVDGNTTVAGTLSPGNSPGTLTFDDNVTWSNGGDYNWQLLNAMGAAGSGYDTTIITGDLNLASLSAGGFSINLWTLSSTGPDVNGSALNFVNTNTYQWTLATAGSITGFDPSKFTVNHLAANGAAGFANDLGPDFGTKGSFSVAVVGNSLVLNYVPEPSAVLLGGIGMLFLLRRRRL
jgi:fibronectin-binding autotransporter adhesin